MNQQLKRIKNKDLSILDEKLFGNLDKVDSINSTLQNLEKFQQFLLTQIGNFQQQAKQNNQPKQVKEVISQNCQTLRQSILRAVPDLQKSRARFRQQLISPTFIKANMLKINQNNEPKKSLRNEKECIRELNLELTELKSNLEEVKRNQKQNNAQLMRECKKNVEQKIYSLLKENTALKKGNYQLKSDNQELKNKINLLKQETDGKSITEKTQQQYMDENRQSSRVNKKISCTEDKSKTYLSFIEKMKFEYSSKLQKKSFDPDQSYNEPSTFRECTNDQIKIDQNSNNAFRFIQMRRQAIQPVQDPKIPLPLRNKLNHQRSSICSESSLKMKIPLEQQNFISTSLNSNSNQSTQKFKENSLVNKKLNHDIMRKTKSNFFQKQNEPEIIFNLNSIKMKQLQNKLSTTDKKRTASKQKLRIFSIL